ncbi:MAG: tRNA adenosine(34) deaminase TadA [Burkholderiaceae bacterium]|nr:MAG: tRNA adenosine(34) deaminase TadA [Burkholderiaceae bacterium]
MTDEQAMRLALDQAHLAAAAGEVPVGAVIVKDGQVLAAAANAPIGQSDPTAHAEIRALRAAARQLGNYRLDDCTLYVTLEPCAMCAGALLHARVDRVVFGAADPKAGAAGSVLDVFAEPRLNHRTQVQGSVLADECGALLRDFFKARRVNVDPLRDDALRTPEAAFADVPDYPWAPHYLNDLPAAAGLRLHYIDAGPRVSPLSWVCLHDPPAWSFLFRHLIADLEGAGQRVLAPDWVGFGKSDKPKKEGVHRFEWHRDVLAEWVESLSLTQIVLVAHGCSDGLGMALVRAAPERYRALVLLGDPVETEVESAEFATAKVRKSESFRTGVDVASWINRQCPRLTPIECSAYAAPFPSRGHCAGLRALSSTRSMSSSSDHAADRPLEKVELKRHWQTKILRFKGSFLPENDRALGQKLRARLLP